VALLLFPQTFELFVGSVSKISDNEYLENDISYHAINLSQVVWTDCEGSNGYGFPDILNDPKVVVFTEKTIAHC
jgi:hypothetical protein